MRVLQICSARDIGGGEKHLADLANELSQRGHMIYVALSPLSPLRAELTKIPREQVLEMPMRNALHLSSAIRLSRFVRKNQIEIVHAHVARDYPLAALATGRSKARLVLTRHVLFPLNPIHKLTLRRTARVIAVSQAVSNALRAQAIFDADKIRLIHNGIDVARFERGREAANNNANQGSNLRVGMIGHLAPIKGQEDFIRAAAIICAQRSDIEFIIAGEDKSRDGQNRPNLEKLIKDLGLENRVRLLGWINDVAELLPMFDLFVSPSRSEPFGLSIVEAMAAGVPVVASNSEGAREIVETGETGRLVPIGNIEAMAQVITELLDNRSELQRLARNARPIACERFSLERMVDQTERVYAELIAP